MTTTSSDQRPSSDPKPYPDGNDAAIADQPESGTSTETQDDIRQSSPHNPRVVDKPEEATEEA